MWNAWQIKSWRKTRDVFMIIARSLHVYHAHWWVLLFDRAAVEKLFDEFVCVCIFFKLYMWIFRREDVGNLRYYRKILLLRIQFRYIRFSSKSFNCYSSSKCYDDYDFCDRILIQLKRPTRQIETGNEVNDCIVVNGTYHYYIQFGLLFRYLKRIPGETFKQLVGKSLL